MMRVIRIDAGKYQPLSLAAKCTASMCACFFLVRGIYRCRMICMVLQIKAQTHFKPTLFGWISVRAAKSNACWRWNDKSVRLIWWLHCTKYNSCKWAHGLTANWRHENYSALELQMHVQGISGRSCNLFPNTITTDENTISGEQINRKNVIKLKYSNSENNYKPQTEAQNTNTKPNM